LEECCEQTACIGLERIEIEQRDVDVPLSARGQEQNLALGGWFADLPPNLQPGVILTSPYQRAISTATAIQGCLKCPAVKLVVDERLREKEFGVLDRLTRQGIQRFYPEQAEIRKSLGKFYHRPPGGESSTPKPGISSPIQSVR
jgi:probable phosphoglycerate mutase